MTELMIKNKLHSFKTETLTQNCTELFERRHHVLIGISPFNSQFSEDYIYRLIGWAINEFENVEVLLAGKEAANLLEALGTPRGKAERKVRKEVSRNKRFAERALKAHGGNPEAIHTFSDFTEQTAYCHLRNEVDDAFFEQPHFRKACLEMSQAAILGRARGTQTAVDEISEAMLNLAVEYVIAELPFFIGAPDILGVEETLLAYHRPWKLGEQISNHEFAIRMRPNQGYLMVTEQSEDVCVESKNLQEVKR
ncbi:tRNA-dependent cyclodipeptide synthase [Bacillus sp. CLL-7-23]|uniref:Cyclodipeptide synthase n=1 Tax=Bacillus changyiensis TaxID=3004103 RepID=A0ABT4X5A3_9BACI|nr:tRNA-dependent cyclodipeptide synthase [Bacillus changyiensis]MDA7027429.1 tRNA-dependent cyclodipeptide synthase [Bacillus changyiensis]